MKGVREDYERGMREIRDNAQKRTARHEWLNMFTTVVRSDTTTHEKIETLERDEPSFSAKQLVQQYRNSSALSCA